MNNLETHMMIQVAFNTLGVLLLIIMWFILMRQSQTLMIKLSLAMKEQARMMNLIQTIDMKTIINSNTSDRIEHANEAVALDLRESRQRADATGMQAVPGEASDAAARS